MDAKEKLLRETWEKTLAEMLKAKYAAPPESYSEKQLQELYEKLYAAREDYYAWYNHERAS